MRADDGRRVKSIVIGHNAIAANAELIYCTIILFFLSSTGVYERSVTRAGSNPPEILAKIFNGF